MLKYLPIRQNCGIIDSEKCGRTDYGKLLIAEDDVLISNLIKKNLCLVGHDCTQVYDGEQKGVQKVFDFLNTLLSIQSKYTGSPVFAER